MLDASIAQLRQDYRMHNLLEQDAPQNPYTLFATWFDNAQAAQIKEPNAMQLCTIGLQNTPQIRTVLLKSYNQNNGFIFFTNYQSNKSKELDANANASILFAWLDVERQVRVSATATKILEQDSIDYFKSRPRTSQLGAWASQQSSVLQSRKELEDAFVFFDKKFENTEIPKPENWGGWALKPKSIEFWQGRTSRLHDRLLYTLEADETWSIVRLAP